MAVGFLMLWVVIGLGVFFVAMRGGPSGARRALYTESRIGRRVTTAAIFLVFAFGIAVPTVVASLNGSHKKSVGPGGVTLDASQQRGRELFARSCATCHTLAGAKAVGRVGPNLDDLRPPVSLVLNAIAQGRARGQGQMPALLYTGQDAKDVASFVAAVAGR